MDAVVDLDWNADTRALHELINEIRAKEPAALQSVADSWLIYALAERDPAEAANALECLVKMLSVTGRFSSVVHSWKVLLLV